MHGVIHHQGGFFVWPHNLGGRRRAEGDVNIGEAAVGGDLSTGEAVVRERGI